LIGEAPDVVTISCGHHDSLGSGSIVIAPFVPLLHVIAVPKLLV
jgi:hypothetical protein